MKTIEEEYRQFLTEYRGGEPSNFESFVAGVMAGRKDDAADLDAAEERGRREAVKEAYRGIFPFGDEADTVSTLLVRNILESVSPGYDALLPEKGKEWPS